jgi:hypothetical protein
MKLTMGVYTDVTQLPVIAETARLPSLNIPDAPTTVTDPSKATEMPGSNGNGHAHRHAHGHAQTGVAMSREQSQPDADDESSALRNLVESVALGHKKAPSDITGRFLKMERAKRLELSTSTLAR